jgi:nucleoside-diphosphate-sugar epimerase
VAPTRPGPKHLGGQRVLVTGGGGFIGRAVVEAFRRAGAAVAVADRTPFVRFTNVYGPGMTGKDSLVPRLMRAALTGQGVDVYGDGTQVRDLVHLDDAVHGVLLAWQRRLVGALTVGSGRTVTPRVELGDGLRGVWREFSGSATVALDSA